MKKTNLINFANEMLVADVTVSTPSIVKEQTFGSLREAGVQPWPDKEPSLKVMSMKDVQRCNLLYKNFLDERRIKSAKGSWRPSRLNYRAIDLAEETFKKSFLPIVADANSRISFGEAKCLFKGYASHWQRVAKSLKGINAAFCYEMAALLRDNSSVRALLKEANKAIVRVYTSK